MRSQEGTQQIALPPSRQKRDLWILGYKYCNFGKVCQSGEDLISWEGHAKRQKQPRNLNVPRRTASGWIVVKQCAGTPPGCSHQSDEVGATLIGPVRVMIVVGTPTAVYFEASSAHRWRNRSPGPRGHGHLSLPLVIRTRMGSF